MEDIKAISSDKRAFSGHENSTCKQRTRFKNTIHLWEFLLELLHRSKYGDIITWTNKHDAEFKLLKPEEVAKQWGKVKHRPKMNYEKLSRSLRFYYKQRILKKVSGHRHIYQFLELPFEYQPLIRLSPYERQKQLLNARKTVLQSKEGDAKSEKSYMLEGDQEETASHRRAETRGSAGTSERQRLLDAQREVSIIPESLLKNATGSNDLKKQSLSQDLTSNERRQSLEGVLCHKISVPRPVINCTKSKNISAEQATRQRSTAFDQPIVNGTSKLVRSTENIQNRYRSGVKSPSVANMHPQNQHLTASYQRRDDHIRVRNYRRSQSADEATETMMPCAFPSPKVYIAREAKTTQCSPFLMDPHRTMSVPTTSLLPWFLDPSCINCIAAKGIKGSRIIFPAGYKKAK